MDGLLEVKLSCTGLMLRGRCIQVIIERRLVSQLSLSCLWLFLNLRWLVLVVIVQEVVI